MELTLLIVLPLLGALVVAFLPKERTELVFPVALGLSILPLAAALWIMVNFVSGEPLFQFTEDYVLSDTFGIAWRVGVDGGRVHLSHRTEPKRRVILETHLPLTVEVQVVSVLDRRPCLNDDFRKCELPPERSTALCALEDLHLLQTREL